MVTACPTTPDTESCDGLTARMYAEGSAKMVSAPSHVASDAMTPRRVADGAISWYSSGASTLATC